MLYPAILCVLPMTAVVAAHTALPLAWQEAFGQYHFLVRSVLGLGKPFGMHFLWYESAQPSQQCKSCFSMPFFKLPHPAHLSELPSAVYAALSTRVRT